MRIRHTKYLRKILLLAVLTCCLNATIVPAENRKTYGDLRFDFDINMDGKFDSKDRELKEKEAFVLGTNNSDVDGDDHVDWDNTRVEDFDNLRKCILRRFSLPATNYSLWFTAQSVPIKNKKTGAERIGTVRLFDSDGNELLPPGESSMRQAPPELVAGLAERDVALYVEGVLGHDARVGVELRTKDGKVIESDRQHITMIGPVATKITGETVLTPYQTLTHFSSSTVIGDFTVANQLLESVIEKTTWERPSFKGHVRIPPKAETLGNGYVSRGNIIVVGGDPREINTLKQLQFYSFGVLRNSNRYRQQAKQDDAVLRHLLTLIRYFADNKDALLHFRNMLKLCDLAKELGERSLSEADATVIADLTLACQDALALTDPHTEDEALLFDKWTAALEQRIRDEQEPIHAIVKQLGHGAYKMRKQADLALREMGDKARPVLEEYLLHDDPEIRLAVKRLLRQQ